MTIPQEVLDVIEKLEVPDQAVIKDYISKLSGEEAEAEIEEEDDNSNKEADFPPLYSEGDDFDKAAEHKQKAADLKSEGKWEEALEEYTSAVLAAEPSALLLANRAICLLKLDRPKAAKHDCDEALIKNPDSAKALRTRGKAFIALEQWKDARHDLSEAQQVDFDEGTVEDLKLATTKMADIEKEEVQAKLAHEEKLKKRAEEIKKAQEEAAKEKAEARASASGGMPGMPGGMPGGMGGSMPGGMPGGGADGLMSLLMSDPEIAEGLQNPKVMAAFSGLMSNPMELMSNPTKMQELMSDPDVGPVMQKIMAKLGPGMGGGAGMPGGMGGMGGMGGAAGGMDDDDEIPDLEGPDDDEMPELD